MVDVTARFSADFDGDRSKYDGRFAPTATGMPASCENADHHVFMFDLVFSNRDLRTDPEG
jgi:hypothetical protein